MKTILAVFLLAGQAAFAVAPSVTVTSVEQSADRTVTITYTLSDGPAIVTLDATDGSSNPIGGEYFWDVRGDVYRRIEKDDARTHTIVWRPDSCTNAVKLLFSELNVSLSAYPVDDPPQYLVADLSTNDTQVLRWYPGEAFLPGGLLGNVAYRTSMLVCRRVNAKNVAWTMGSEDCYVDQSPRRAVTLTNDYYVGVFELTQGQRWMLAPADSRAQAYFPFEGDWAMRPVERISYTTLRGGTGNLWPNPPAATSILGRLRDRTKLDFDLPSEAEWEFAAAADQHKAWTWNNGVQLVTKSENGYYAAKNMPGRYSGNSNYTVLKDMSKPWTTIGATNGTAVCGSYAPSTWGFYDMHGNVAEWCLDWYVNWTKQTMTSLDWVAAGLPNCNGDKLADGEDRKNGYNHVIRGGEWTTNPLVCRVTARQSDYFNLGNTSEKIGCRVFWRLP